MRHILCLSLVLATSCVFSGKDPVLGNNATNNSTIATNNTTTGSNNATIAPTNNTTPSPNNIPSSNNGTTSTNNATNNNTVGVCMFGESVLGQLCALANDNPIAMPLVGEFSPPAPCETATCGTCAPGATRGNFCLPELATLTNPSPEWGRALAISDRYLAISPTQLSTAAPPEIRIYDFQKGDFWLGAMPVVDEQTAGWAMSIVGDELVVSSPGRDVIEVHFLDASTEAPLPGFGEFTPPPEIGEAGTSQWGFALATASVQNTTAVFIGAPDVNYVNLASRTTSDPAWTMEPFGAALVSSVPAGAMYGAALAVDESMSTLAVGAPGAGEVYIWIRSGGWQQDTVIAAPNGERSFGSSIAMSRDGDLLAVGSPLNANDDGAVHLYLRDNNAWTLIADSAGDNGGQLGASVALYENVMLVGAPRANAVATFVGHPDVGYARTGAFSPPNTNLRPGFGRAIVAGFGRVAISATNSLASSNLSGIFIGEFGTGF